MDWLTWIVGIVGFALGSCFGLLIAGLAAAAGDAEPPTITDIEARLRGDA